MPENEREAPAAEAQQNLSKGGDAKAEATSTAKPADELAKDDLETVAGGAWSRARS